MWVKTQTGDLVNLELALSVTVEQEENGFLVLASYAGDQECYLITTATQEQAELVLRALSDGLAGSSNLMSMQPWDAKYRQKTRQMETRMNNQNNSNQNANSLSMQVKDVETKHVFSVDANQVEIGINFLTGLPVVLLKASDGESLNMEYPTPVDALETGVQIIVVAACAGAKVPDDLPAQIASLVAQTREVLAQSGVSTFHRGSGGTA